ncbi:MAG: dihydroorotate dehydrogenase (quinone), partial [Pedobacter sp.]
MYRLIKPVFFKFDPEKVHHFVVKRLKWFNDYFPLGKTIIRGSYDI